MTYHQQRRNEDDFAIGQDSIRIEEVKDNEVIRLVAELPLAFEVEAEALCNAHNATISNK